MIEVVCDPIMRVGTIIVDPINEFAIWAEKLLTGWEICRGKRAPNDERRSGGVQARRY